MTSFDQFEEQYRAQKRPYTMNDYFEEKRLKRKEMHATYESPLIFDLDNPYGPSGVYDQREIPFPLVPKNHAEIQAQRLVELRCKFNEGRLSRDEVYEMLERPEVKWVDSATVKALYGMLA